MKQSMEQMTGRGGYFLNALELNHLHLPARLLTAYTNTGRTMSVPASSRKHSILHFWTSKVLFLYTHCTKSSSTEGQLASVSYLNFFNVAG